MKKNLNSTKTNAGLTLVPGWTGKIGHPIVQRLEGRGVPARIAVDNVDHVRTIAAMVAALLFAIGLMQKDGN